MQLQVENKFQQVKIKNLHDKYGVEMFTTTVRGGKAFAAELIIIELKSKTGKLNALKMKLLPTTIILQFSENMNNFKSNKYSASLNNIEQTAID